MVRKPLIRFDRQVLIQELKEEKTLTPNTQSVIFNQILHVLFHRKTYNL